MEIVKFKSLDHTADVKYEVTGKSFNILFENIAQAFSSYVSSDSKISPKIKKTIKLDSDNLETLLYKFLDELIYLLDAENFVVSKAKVKVKDLKLQAILYGDNTKDYHLNHVKSATYAEMYIKKTSRGFKAQFVLDV